MGNQKDLTGQVFGTIKVLGYAGKDKNCMNIWDCICMQCNRRTIKSTNSLRRGKSCMSCSRKKHGYSYTSLYHCWQLMKQRCQNTNCNNYKNYGGRGIKLCGEWNNFEIFRKWALKNGYRDGLEIDRINVNSDYCPENCRWTTNRTQANNRRNNNYYEIDGIKHTLMEWTRIFGKNFRTVYGRIERGWKIEEALKTKVDKRIGQAKVEKYILNGISKSLYDWSEVFQISPATVRKRMKRGMTLAQALGVSDGK